MNILKLSGIFVLVTHTFHEISDKILPKTIPIRQGDTVPDSDKVSAVEYSDVEQTLRGGPAGYDRRLANDGLQEYCVFAARLLVQCQTASAAVVS